MEVINELDNEQTLLTNISNDNTILKPYITISTYNVLNPVRIPILKQLLAEDVRFEYHVQHLLLSLKADVLCLQEVTEKYIEYINKTPSLKDQYYLTKPPISREETHFPFIMSKRKFVVLRNFDRCVLVVMEKDEVGLLVASVHFPPKDGDIKLREDYFIKLDLFIRELGKIVNEINTFNEETKNSINQSNEYNEKKKSLSNDARFILDELVLSGFNIEDLSRMINNAIDNNNIMILGDFNYNYPVENKILDELNYSDVWLEKHSHFDGITWDTNINTMTKYILPFDDRLLRLDRIALKKSSQLEINSIKLFGNKQMDRFLLFPSDHFGITGDFIISKNRSVSDSENNHKLCFNKLDPLNHGGRSGDTITTYRVIFITILFLILFQIIYRIIRKLNGN